MWTQKNLPTDEPMSRLKIETVFRQFTWAEEYAYGRPVTRAYVQRVEPSLLWYERQMQYRREYGTDECGGSYSYLVEGMGSERVILVDGNGKIVTHTEHVPMERRKYIFWGPKISWTEPVVHEVGWIETTIADALKRLSVDEVATIRFVLSYWERTTAPCRNGSNRKRKESRNRSKSTATKSTPRAQASGSNRYLSRQTADSSSAVFFIYSYYPLKQVLTSYTEAPYPYRN